ncbi:DUF2834 domain-containing protein [Agrococcus sp. TF02-05]|uniref:DUF2834 domain-containing protein n=1 Tax=Agrococcus sp. TF02-05 TaxID=2815211 RepID=UPI001AA0EC84|nr:DUF2834 domain-containing protein [Agrococcus sp. TF02-05]MBO1771077.1 DUF2834 domain-containing protein [Agrococcus sp. TF02-05]
MADRAEHRRRIPAVAVLWFALSAAGLVGTMWFNVAFVLESGGADYFGAWFANAATASASTDLVVVAVAAAIFMVVEGTRLGWAKRAWVLVALSAVTAIAFTFPLFLGLRAVALASRDAEARA